MCRGVWGELAIIGAWALVVIGSAILTEHDVTDNSVIIGLSYGLMVANILFVNQIPDIEADRNAEKLTLAVISSKEHLWFWSMVIPACAYSILIAAIYLNLLPTSYALPLLTLPISLITARQLSSAIDDSKTLKKCIQKTILTTHLFGLLMLLSIWMS
jgi:1,4-dihydroxy-2-naphthoate octaprenyltransferase